MTTLKATVPSAPPPAWAVLERHLLDVAGDAVYPFLDKYTTPDGELIWGESPGGSEDDFYEAFYNWPLLYTLGGGDHLLELSDRAWDAVTRQLTRYGLVKNEYSRRDDQFHQGESDIYFYLLCLSTPEKAVYVNRAQRFAGQYMNENPELPHYDPALNIIRCPYNGSDPPSMTFFGKYTPSYGWSSGMARYSLPFFGLPAIASVEDLKDPEKAKTMGEAIERAMSRGDIPSNLAVTSLTTNAFLLTGEEKYRGWTLEYIDAWHDRTRKNGGLIPDTVGLSGQIGEYIEGKWYGGLYGWTWPHGFYNLQMAVQLAAANAYLLTGDAGYLEWPRAQIKKILELGEMRDIKSSAMSLHEHWIGQHKALKDRDKTFLVPYRYGDAGWFDYQPMSPIYPVALWSLSMRDDDWALIDDLRRKSGYDWRQTFSFHTKEDAGHEQPWTRYLAGDNPSYPEDILATAIQDVHRRLTLIREDEHAATHGNVHHWQQCNPVTTEALIQLTLGGPQLIYNGGLLMTRLLYFDPQRGRPGLPQNVAALVEKLEAKRTVVRLVNLSTRHEREIIVQGGAFGEHRFTSASFTARTSDYPGVNGAYTHPDITQTTQTAVIDGSRFRVVLPPGMEIVLDLGMERFTQPPAYGLSKSG
ncbi:MAG: hypothetical protein FJY97_03920 [candidate division Zixibacteria bacterium]|nr:hypothetical protein [candidate division Zixibacteria bacterium]